MTDLLATLSSSAFMIWRTLVSAVPTTDSVRTTHLFNPIALYNCGIGRLVCTLRARKGPTATRYIFCSTYHLGTVPDAPPSLRARAR